MKQQNRTPTKKSTKSTKGYRLTPELAERIDEIADSLGVPKTWVVETYLSAALGMRKMPELPKIIKVA